MNTSLCKTPLKECLSWLKARGKNLARFFREEDLLKAIVHSFRTDLLKSEKIIACLFLLAALIIPLATEITNSYGHKYDTLQFLSWDVLLPGCAFLLFLVLKLREHVSYVGSLLFIVFATGMSTIGLAAGATSILSSPFGPNDLSHALLHFDLWIGFHQGHIMNWLRHYPGLHFWLQFSYFSITTQVAATALVFAVFRCFKSARLYILTILVCSLVAYVIYYFWPTFAPAYVIHNAIFPQSTAHLIERTQHIRQHLPYQLYPQAGLIAFPSCHVIMGLAGIFCWITAAKEVKRIWIKHLFIIISVLSVIVNISLIAATVLLGYHYVTDVLASFLIFGIAWAYFYRMVKKEKSKLR